MMESVAVADVPDAPLSTIGGAGIIPLGEPLAAQFTLTLLLLKHLEGDGSQFGIRSEDAVSVKGGFVHEHKLDQMGQKSIGGGQSPDCHMPLSISPIAKVITHRLRTSRSRNRAGTSTNGTDPLCRPCWIILQR